MVTLQENVRLYRVMNPGVGEIKLKHKQPVALFTPIGNQAVLDTVASHSSTCPTNSDFSIPEFKDNLTAVNQVAAVSQNEPHKSNSHANDTSISEQGHDVDSNNATCIEEARSLGFDLDNSVLTEEEKLDFLSFLGKNRCFCQISHRTGHV